MRRKHKKGVVSSVYDYIFLLHPSSSDPRATILLVSDAGCLTMYKRACYFKTSIKAGLRMQHYPHGMHVHNGCIHVNHHKKRNVFVVCLCSGFRNPVSSRVSVTDVERCGPLYPVKGYDRLSAKLQWPPYVCKTI